MGLAHFHSLCRSICIEEYATASFPASELKVKQGVLKEVYNKKIKQRKSPDIDVLGLIFINGDMFFIKHDFYRKFPEVFSAFNDSIKNITIHYASENNNASFEENADIYDLQMGSRIILTQTEARKQYYKSFVVMCLMTFFIAGLTFLFYREIKKS